MKNKHWFINAYNCCLFAHMNTCYVHIYLWTTYNMGKDCGSQGRCYMGAALYRWYVYLYIHIHIYTYIYIYIYIWETTDHTHTHTHTHTYLINTPVVWASLYSGQLCSLHLTDLKWTPGFCRQNGLMFWVTKSQGLYLYLFSHRQVCVCVCVCLHGCVWLTFWSS